MEVGKRYRGAAGLTLGGLVIVHSGFVNGMDAPTLIGTRCAKVGASIPLTKPLYMVRSDMQLKAERIEGHIRTFAAYLRRVVSWPSSLEWWGSS